MMCLWTAILEMYQWLVCYLIDRTCGRLQTMRQEGCDGFTAQNHSQVYCARSLAMAYGEVSTSYLLLPLVCSQLT